MEVVPERKPPAMDLAALDVAGSRLGKYPRNNCRVKKQVQELKLKAIGDPARVYLLYHQMKEIATKIKDTENISLLEKNEEYIALVGEYLSKEIMWSCWNNNSLGGLASILSWKAL